MLWIELAVCNVRITPDCIATDRQNKSTIVSKIQARLNYEKKASNVHDNVQ